MRKKYIYQLTNNKIYYYYLNPVLESFLIFLEIFRGISGSLPKKSVKVASKILRDT